MPNLPLSNIVCSCTCKLRLFPMAVITSPFVIKSELFSIASDDVTRSVCRTPISKYRPSSLANRLSPCGRVRKSGVAGIFIILFTRFSSPVNTLEICRVSGNWHCCALYLRLFERRGHEEKRKRRSFALVSENLWTGLRRSIVGSTSFKGPAAQPRSEPVIDVAVHLNRQSPESMV